VHTQLHKRRGQIGLPIESPANIYRMHFVGIPQEDAAIISRRGDLFAIGRELTVVNRAAMLGEFSAILVRAVIGHLPDDCLAILAGGNDPLAVGRKICRPDPPIVQPQCLNDFG
jgi:hypothetical protein